MKKFIENHSNQIKEEDKTKINNYLNDEKNEYRRSEDDKMNKFLEKKIKEELEMNNVGYFLLEIENNFLLSQNHIFSLIKYFINFQKSIFTEKTNVKIFVKFFIKFFVENKKEEKEVPQPSGSQIKSFFALNGITFIKKKNDSGITIKMNRELFDKFFQNNNDFLAATNISYFLFSDTNIKNSDNRRKISYAISKNRISEPSVSNKISEEDLKTILKECWSFNQNIEKVIEELVEEIKESEEKVEKIKESVSQLESKIINIIKEMFISFSCKYYLNEHTQINKYLSGETYENFIDEFQINESQL